MLLSDRIHARLRDQILSGDLAPGAAVPSERRLAEQLGASRHAVREALKRLQEAGLIRISHGGATRVRDWRHDGGLDLLLAVAAQGDLPPELEVERAGMELRACIGADAARRAAERATPAQRAEIVAAAEALAATADPDARNLEYERPLGRDRRRRGQRRLPARAQHAQRRPARARARRRARRGGARRRRHDPRAGGRDRHG